MGVFLPYAISRLSIATIQSIDWTNITALPNLGVMHYMEQTTDLETEPSTHECECPEPCNCDHEND
jgi:hypothetical protein